MPARPSRPARPHVSRVRRELRRLARRAQITVRHRVGRAAEFPHVRDFAYCTDEEGLPPLIVTAPKLERAALPRIRGILAHELGHAAHFVAGRPHHREVDADRVGAQITRTPVRYDVQTIETSGRGTARPAWLPQ